MLSHPELTTNLGASRWPGSQNEPSLLSAAKVMAQIAEHRYVSLYIPLSLNWVVNHMVNRGESSFSVLKSATTWCVIYIWHVAAASGSTVSSSLSPSSSSMRRSSTTRCLMSPRHLRKRARSRRWRVCRVPSMSGTSWTRWSCLVWSLKHQKYDDTWRYLCVNNDGRCSWCWGEKWMNRFV